MSTKRTYKVVAEVLTTHEFEVEEVNSPEEAISIAEQWIQDGEDGSTMGRDIYEVDAYPVEN